MNLDDIRDASRASVHAQFAIPAVVTPVDESLPQVPVTARLHRDLKKPFGDLDREGFAMVIEQHNQVVFDVREWQTTHSTWRPKRGDAIDFGRGRTFELGDTLSDRADPYYLKMEVTIKR